MLQRYIRAKVTLGMLSFVFSSLAMLMLGFPHPLALGVIAGILEFIPIAGWMMAAATIVSVGVLAHSHWIWMLALLGAWRVCMDYAISPRVMGHELEIHPLLAIFAVMVGGAVGGIVGVYLSIPLVAGLRVVWGRLPADRDLNSLLFDLVSSMEIHPRIDCFRFCLRFNQQLPPLRVPTATWIGHHCELTVAHVFRFDGACEYSLVIGNAIQSGAREIT